MEVLTIVAIITAVVLITGAFITCCLAINERCALRDKMEPINGWSIFSICVATASFYAGVLIIFNNADMSTWPPPSDFMDSISGNGLALMGLGLVIAIVTYATLLVKCSFWNGVLGSMLLTFAGFFIVLILFMLIAATILYIAATQEQKQRRRY